MLGEGGVMPKYNCMDLKKYGGGVGWLCQNIFYGFEKMLGGGGLCQNILWGVEIVWGVEKCLGVCQQILCMDLKKKLGGGGVMPKY